MEAGCKTLDDGDGITVDPQDGTAVSHWICPCAQIGDLQAQYSGVGVGGESIDFGEDCFDSYVDITVKVENSVYTYDDGPTLSLQGGVMYRFDQSDFTNGESGTHLFRIATELEGAGDTDLTYASIEGTLGTNGAAISYLIPVETIGTILYPLQKSQRHGRCRPCAVPYTTFLHSHRNKRVPHVYG